MNLDGLEKNSCYSNLFGFNGIYVNFYGDFCLCLKRLSEISLLKLSTLISYAFKMISSTKA